VDDAGFVRGGQRVGNLNRNVERQHQRQPRLRKPLAQSLSLDKFSGDEVRRIRFEDFVNGDDVGVVERGGRAGFLLKAAQTIVVFGE
jgi:hypothetical protein